MHTMKTVKVQKTKLYPSSWSMNYINKMQDDDIYIFL